MDEFLSGRGTEIAPHALKEYFYHRGGQERSYPTRWGDTGKTYIAREWGTTEDRRIEQQIRDLYDRGYLDPKALDKPTEERVSAMVQGLKATQQPCKS